MGQDHISPFPQRYIEVRNEIDAIVHRAFALIEGIMNVGRHHVTNEDPKLLSSIRSGFGVQACI